MAKKAKPKSKLTREEAAGFRAGQLSKVNVEIFTTGARGCWRACFKIGVQTFTVAERETRKEAEWFCKCLRTAFSNIGVVDTSVRFPKRFYCNCKPRKQEAVLGMPYPLPMVCEYHGQFIKPAVKKKKR